MKTLTTVRKLAKKEGCTVPPYKGPTLYVITNKNGGQSIRLTLGEVDLRFIGAGQ
jgi:hypothetical protein